MPAAPTLHVLTLHSTVPPSTCTLTRSDSLLATWSWGEGTRRDQTGCLKRLKFSSERVCAIKSLSLHPSVIVGRHSGDITDGGTYTPLSLSRLTAVQCNYGGYRIGTCSSDGSSVLVIQSH